MEIVCDITDRTFYELTRLARLPYKADHIDQLRFDEASMLCDFCYAHINDLRLTRYGQG
jgi:hypothetical protein